MKKKLIVGLDFDGVVAYNPARLARFPVAFVKHTVLGIKTVRFFVPKTPVERAVWALLHESSVIPAFGVSYLRSLVTSGRVEAHLVTSRFGYLEPNLRRFLRRWNLTDLFTSVTINDKEEQPHEFKARIIRIRFFDHFVEDNWDIVSYLARQRGRTKIHWIYNLFDRGKPYPRKYPYLQKALEAIQRY